MLPQGAISDYTKMRLRPGRASPRGPQLGSLQRSPDPLARFHG